MPLIQTQLTADLKTEQNSGRKRMTIEFPPDPVSFSPPVCHAAEANGDVRGSVPTSVGRRSGTRPLGGHYHRRRPKAEAIQLKPTGNKPAQLP